MYDRNVEFPQRYRLQKVDGTDDIFDLIPAPGEIGNEGTLINKTSLLTDATAALFGLGTNAVPNDVLNVLSRFQSKMGDEHIWKRTLELSAEIPAGYTLGAVETNVVMWAVTSDDTHCGGTKSASVSVDDNGKVSLVDGAAFSARYSIWSANELKASLAGYFIIPDGGSAVGTSDIYYIPSDTTFTLKSGNPYQIIVSKVQKVTGYAKVEAGTHIDYVNSPNADAYSDTDSEGRTYTYLGQLGNKVQIATGSYTGTGKYGASNPNKLTFGFEPRIVFIYAKYESKPSYAEPTGYYVSLRETFVYPYECGSNYEVQSASQGYFIQATWGGKTLSWWAQDQVTTSSSGMATSSLQHNSSGSEYRYIAIG